MKNNDEMFQSVISRLDLYLEQKEKKKLYIRRFAPVIASLCFAFVICFAVWDGKKPDPLPEIDNMIVTETTSANTTALPQITEKNITSITEAVTTSLNVRSDTTVSSVNTTQVSSNITQVTSDPQSHIVSVVTTESVHSDTVITSASITKTSSINTTIKTTTRTSVNTTSGTTIRATTRTTVNTTNGTTIRTTARTTVNTTNGTTIRTTARTTVNTTNRTTIRTTVRTTVNSSTTTISTLPPAGIDGNYITYMDKKYLITGKSFIDANMKELFNDYVNISGFENNTVLLKLYEIDDISVNYAIASKIDNEQEFRLCRGSYEPETMQSLFSDTALNKYWNIQSIVYEKEEFNDIDQSKAFDILINLPDIKRADTASPGRALMIINLRSELFGDAEIQLSERGYLSSNQIGQNSYYIGRDEVDKIITGIKNEML